MSGLPFILKGLLIGLIVSLPIGPIMILTIQKAVNDGRKAGFSCGLGATAVDTTWAVVSAFALSAIGDMIDKYTVTIEIVGGIFIALVGVGMFLTKIALDRTKTPFSGKNFIKATTMGFSNPAALAVMLAMFTFFKMDMSGLPAYVPVLAILAVCAGSAGFWYLFSRIVAHFGDKFNFKVLVIINRLAGTGVILFGLYLLLEGIGIL